MGKHLGNRKQHHKLEELTVSLVVDTLNRVMASIVRVIESCIAHAIVATLVETWSKVTIEESVVDFLMLEISRQIKNIGFIQAIHKLRPKGGLVLILLKYSMV